MINDNDLDFAAMFGGFIRDGRLSKQLSQKELATAMGMDQSYLSLLEKGLRRADLELAFRLCSHLDLDLNVFLKNQKP